TSGAAAGGIADAAGGVSEQEDHRVPVVLQGAHHPQVHGMAEVQVGGGEVHAELDPQASALPQAVQQVLAADDRVGGALERGQELLGRTARCGDRVDLVVAVR